MKTKKLILSLLGVSALLSSPLRAGMPSAEPSNAPPAPPESSKTIVKGEVPKHSFLAPVSDFVRDSIFQPKVPFELVPGKNANDWGFAIEPYTWLTSLSGTTSVHGLPAMGVNARSKTLLQNLNWGIMGQAEVRKGRWGILIDGYYASLSGSRDLGGGIYKEGSIDIQQAFASMALAYRIIDDRRGFLDFYAGGRYNYIGLQMDLTVDKDGVSAIAEGMSARLAKGIDTKVSDILTSNSGILEADLARLSKDALTAKALEKLAGTPDPIREALKASALRRILNSRRGAFADYIAAAAAVRVAAALGRDTTALRAAAISAKKKLDAQLSRDIQEALPTHGSGSEWWIDPIIGLRGQINITRWLYLAAQGDVGGFGVGSQIAWNTQATIGVNFTRNVFAELGYRYMYVDYNKNNFLYNMNTYGVFSSIGVKW